MSALFALMREKAVLDAKIRQSRIHQIRLALLAHKPKGRATKDAISRMEEMVHMCHPLYEEVDDLLTFIEEKSQWYPL